MIVSPVSVEVDDPREEESGGVANDLVYGVRSLAPPLAEVLELRRNWERRQCLAKTKPSQKNRNNYNGNGMVSVQCGYTWKLCPAIQLNTIQVHERSLRIT